MSQTEIDKANQEISNQQSPARGVVQPRPMHALSGIRFFAIFIIFLHHLWTIYSIRAELPPPYDLVYVDFDSFPNIWLTFISHGWMATSFFLLLSGFMMGYLYWGNDGKLTVKPKRFLVLRLSRIYPIHFIVIALLMIMVSFGVAIDQGRPLSQLILGGVTTLTLTQAWFPPMVPVWSWPSWNLSAIVFLYVITPWLMPALARLTMRQTQILLATLPFISIIPTAVFAIMGTQGFEWTQNTDIFVCSTPLFWVPHYAAGLLLTRVFSLSRFHPPEPSKRRWISLGDVCMAAAMLLAFSDVIDTIDERNFFRHGLMMPLYVMVIVDLARGQGLTSRFFSLPGMKFLGETGFSIFVWQAFFMALGFYMLKVDPGLAHGQIWFVSAGVIVFGIISTYLVEKPIQRKIREHFLLNKKH